MELILESLTQAPYESQRRGREVSQEFALVRIDEVELTRQNGIKR
jgi:hypothetical protein